MALRSRRSTKHEKTGLFITFFYCRAWGVMNDFELKARVPVNNSTARQQ